MANIDPRLIERLLDETEKLAKAIKWVGDTETRNLIETGMRDVRAAACNEANKFDPARWIQMSERKQIKVKDQLIMTRDELRDVARRVDRHDETQATDGAESPAPVIWLAILSIIFAATLLSLVC